MIAKQSAQRENTNPVCLYVVEKYKKVEIVDTQNHPEITSKKWVDIKKTRPVLCVL